MDCRQWKDFLRNIVIVAGVLSLPLVSGCGDNSSSQRETSSAVSAQSGLPMHGKVKQAQPPAKAAFGMIYIDSTDNREYIFDGKEWVPHGKEVDSFYKTTTIPAPVVKGISEAAGDSCTSYACNPGGAHMKHSTFKCTDCHMMHGGERFNPLGPAVIQATLSNPSPPKPGFNPMDNSCSNIACHGVPAGVFYYYFPGGDGEPELHAVNYGGTMAANTPSWYANGAACGSCHGNPSPYYTWHSGRHATNIAGANECQFCHPDASGSGGHGTTITNTALHKNGSVEVQARFTSKCFGCH